jgi:hypothetical protein
MIRFLFLSAISAILFLSGCGLSKMSVSQPPATENIQIKRLAITSDPGILGDAIAKELENRGLQVLTPVKTSAILGQLVIDDHSVSSEAYAALRTKGIDSVLRAEAKIADDGTPDTVSVRLIDIIKGNFLIGIRWENAWGGASDSEANRIMRRNIFQAAEDIAKELLERLGLETEGRRSD